MVGVLASVEVNSTFIDEIKAKYFNGGKLNKLQNKVVCGEASNAILDTCGVLSFRGWICVSLFGDLIKNMLAEAHSLRYFINQGATKMYRDLRKLYWWLDMKRDKMDYVSKCYNYR